MLAVAEAIPSWSDTLNIRKGGQNLTIKIHRVLLSMNNKLYFAHYVIDMGDFTDSQLSDLLEEAEICVSKIQDEIDLREDENE